MPIAELPGYFPALHISVEHSWMLRPAESHHLFGAGFLLLASLLAIEALAGGVWFRSTARALIFPAVLVTLGVGMLAVTAIEPGARIAHFAMGLPMSLGGWAEARYRLGEMPRRYADILITAALAFAALETAMFHLNGDPTGGVFLAHAGLVVMAVVIAGLRLYQSLDPPSMGRAMLIAGAIAVIGIILFTDAEFQPSGTTQLSTAVDAAAMQPELANGQP